MSAPDTKAGWPEAWTGPEQIRERMKRLWDNGQLPGALLGEPGLFPLRVSLKGPATRDWTAQMQALMRWIQALSAQDPDSWQLEWRELAHRELGKNRYPVAAVIPDMATAVALAGKQAAAKKLLQLYHEVTTRRPGLAAWVRAQPLALLDHAPDWPAILACLDWFEVHPRPGCHSRAIAAAGVHGKFVETNRSLLGELLDLVLPGCVAEAEAAGTRNFNRRFGLLDKPELVRLRFLDPALAPALYAADLVPQELSLRAAQFASDGFGRALAERGLGQVLVLENEITWLSLPAIPGTLALLGSGYGFSHLAGAAWLCRHRLWYWGDLDTHGFAILGQFRSRFPAARSLLMDLPTLLAHRELWTDEPRPASGPPAVLDERELQAWQALTTLRPGTSVRLEQERLSWQHVLGQLAALAAGIM